MCVQTNDDTPVEFSDLLLECLLRFITVSHLFFHKGTCPVQISDCP